MRGEYYLFAVIVILTIGIIVLIDLQTSLGFSEVYFDNSTVPAYLTPNTTYNVVFIIESHEKSSEEYSFKIYLNNVVVKEGNVSLGPGETAQVRFKFSINKLRYKGTVLEERIIAYNITGIPNITKRWLGGGCVLNTNSSCVWELPKHIAPMYVGHSNLSLLLNTSKNITLTKVVEDKNNTIKISKRYQLTLIKLGNDTYRIIIRESKIMYLPKPITIKIIVETSDGKVYQIFRRLPTMEG